MAGPSSSFKLHCGLRRMSTSIRQWALNRALAGNNFVLGAACSSLASTCLGFCWLLIGSCSGRCVVHRAIPPACRGGEPHNGALRHRLPSSHGFGFALPADPVAPSRRPIIDGRCAVAPLPRPPSKPSASSSPAPQPSTASSRGLPVLPSLDPFTPAPAASRSLAWRLSTLRAWWRSSPRRRTSSDSSCRGGRR